MHVSIARFSSALFLLAVAPFCSFCHAQQASNLLATGSVVVDGVSRPYEVHHLPVSSFPDLPAEVAGVLAARGCTIPQSYEARGPENVVHGSFERAGSSDWAVLCSAKGMVSLMVFFADAPQISAVLASAAENSRLQMRPGRNALGFNWGIDAASPERVHDAQNGLMPRPQMLEHDALADSTLEGGVVYRYYSRGAWSTAPLPE